MEGIIAKSARELPRQGEIYLHFKGTRYVVAGISTIEKTGNLAVKYVKYVGDLNTDLREWIRPLDEFMGTAYNPFIGMYVYRFIKVPQEE